ncbi:MAG TPA: thymidylate kinase [Candidatus Paceibacterota bacterium]|jgi:dTMP kinase|nr:thymidylate kinase [Candidatus Paceibacterota bacterium]
MAKKGKPRSEFWRSAKHAVKTASPKSTTGKLIVIDGADGSGKATQVELLHKRLKKEGHIVKIIDFPEYYKNFFGKFIGHCLSEQYYNWLNIHPKIASMAYAADRWESSAEVREWLKKGHIVLANRYVSANQIHQGGKIANNKKRADFIKWLDEMEYEVFKIPRPDITLYLDLPTKIVLKLLQHRNSSKMKRAYLKNKKDVHEMDINFLLNSRKSALKLVKEIKNFIKIDCTEKGIIKTRENIHQEIYEKVKKIIK